MNWLKRVFHQHDFETFQKEKVAVYSEYDNTIPVQYKYIELQRCKVCGKIRKQVLVY